MLLLDLQSYGTGLGTGEMDETSVRATGMEHTIKYQTRKVYLHQDELTVSPASIKQEITCVNVIVTSV